MLTPAGRSFLARLDMRIDTAQDSLLGPLSAGERREFSRLLRKLLGTD